MLLCLFVKSSFIIINHDYVLVSIKVKFATSTLNVLLSLRHVCSGFSPSKPIFERLVDKAKAPSMPLLGLRAMACQGCMHSKIRAVLSDRTIRLALGLLQLFWQMSV